MRKKEKIILVFAIFFAFIGIFSNFLFLPIGISAALSPSGEYLPGIILGGFTLEALEYVWAGEHTILDIKFDSTLSALIILLAIVAWIVVPILLFLITKGISWKRRIVYVYFIFTGYCALSANWTLGLVNFFI